MQEVGAMNDHSLQATRMLGSLMCWMRSAIRSRWSSMVWTTHEMIAPFDADHLKKRCDRRLACNIPNSERDDHEMRSARRNTVRMACGECRSLVPCSERVKAFLMWTIVVPPCAYDTEGSCASWSKRASSCCAERTVLRAHESLSASRSCSLRRHCTSLLRKRCITV